MTVPLPLVGFWLLPGPCGCSSRREVIPSTCWLATRPETGESFAPSTASRTRSPCEKGCESLAPTR